VSLARQLQATGRQVALQADCLLTYLRGHMIVMLLAVVLYLKVERLNSIAVTQQVKSRTWN